MLLLRLSLSWAEKINDTANMKDVLMMGEAIDSNSLIEGVKLNL